MNLVSNPRRVRILVLSLVALFFSFFVWHHRLDLMAIRIYNWQDIPQLILLICATYLTFAMQKRSLFSMYGVKLGLVESVGLVTMNTAGNLLLPARAGAISSAIYLKSAHNLEYVAICWSTRRYRLCFRCTERHSGHLMPLQGKYFIRVHGYGHPWAGRCGTQLLGIPSLSSQCLLGTSTSSTEFFCKRLECVFHASSAS